ncbi:MAG: bifunctional lysylphosphatidylglycerol synthetase/lysine--tRNA ligase LysX [Bifidobacteriaceae bacterium]|jgi:lysyl-tRNA synthetase class 2|nr:bifunctional lysylphosphatidylglycerol synthetase/lysine--tRNA ligase LysX [Bifidobacteriaceae bacterium]
MAKREARASIEWRADRTPVWAARILGFAAVWAVAAWPMEKLFPHAYRVIWLALDAVNLPGNASLFNCAALLVLASAIRHRKRAAMWAVIILVEGPAVVYAGILMGAWAAGLDWSGLVYPGLVFRLGLDTVPARVAVSAAVAIAIAVWLMARRRAFGAPVSMRAAGRAALTLAAGLSVAGLWAFGWAVAVGEKTASLGLKAWWAVNVALGQGPEEIVTGVSIVGRQHWLEPITDHIAPGWVARTTSILATLALLAALVVFTRSERHLPAITGEQELALRRLLWRHGEGDSLGYYNLRHDKSAVFSADGQAAVVGKLVGGILLASSDPVGDRASWADAIGRWIDLARRHGWTPAVVSATRRGGRAWQAAGLRSLELGDEAIIHPDRFSLRDRRLRDVAEAARRLRRAGYTVKVRRQQDIEADEMAVLARDADFWRRGDERGFSMTSGRVGDPTDGRDLIVTAHDPDGLAKALLTFAPWGRRGVSLDIMRHDPRAHGGTTELMVTGLVEAARDLGIERISLNFAVLRRFLVDGGEVGAYPMARLVRRVLLLASRWWQIDGLYRSNEKYAPDWQPRVICFDRGASLAEVVLAVGRAEGFLPDNSPDRLLPGGGHPDRRPDPGLVAAVEELDRSQLAAPQADLAAPDAAAAGRLAHRSALAAAGVESNPVAVPRTISLRDALRLAEGRVGVGTGAEPAQSAQPGEPAQSARADALDGIGQISAVGRILRKRDHGGVVFADLREGVAELQVMLRRDRAAGFELFKRHAQLGDLVSATGRLALSRTGQLSLDADGWLMAAKSVAAPPSKRRLADAPVKPTPALARAPHLVLATNNRAFELIYARSAATAGLRAALRERDFIEVETPILQPIHGGANARPFRTHINAYDMDLYLRIAPELYLKRLAVGGVERVFELGKNFRNEGVDRKHNPEFTSLEAYQAFSDYDGMRLLTQDLIRSAALAVHGRAVAVAPDGREVSLAGDWPVVTVHDAVAAALGEPVAPDISLAGARALAARARVACRDEWTAGEIISELYDELVEGQTFEPTFYKDFPVETSPLTRRHRSIPGLAERWDLVAFGAEVGTAYSELTDPVDERGRLTAQSAKAAAGDPEAMEIDQDFLNALDFGLVPTGGLGLGVDRVVMTLTGTNIRDTLTFPFARPA